MDFDYVNNILGEEIYNIGRCSSMCWIIFGSEEKWNNEESYSLHIQCPWRIRKKNEMLISYVDFYVFSQEEAQENEEWDDRKRNVFDEKIEKFPKKGVRVEKVVVTEMYDLIIYLSDSLVIECFVDDSNYECWRLFRKDAKEHLVVNGKGIEV